MTCCEGFTSCNGFFYMALSVLAICLNLLPLVIDYTTDGNLFVNPVSCYEWWLPGVIGGGILVLPAVAMSHAAKKEGAVTQEQGNCPRWFATLSTPDPSMLICIKLERMILNENTFNLLLMLMSAVLCLPSIIGAMYWVLISLYALGRGPLIYEKGSGAHLSSCDFTINKTSSTAHVDFNWYLNKDGCGAVSLPPDSETNSTLLNSAENLNIDLDAVSVKNYHLITFAGLSILGLLEIVVSLLQIIAGAFGCL